MQAASSNLKVAIYSDTGAAADKTLAIYRAVAAAGHRPMAVNHEDLLQGRLTLANFDVLILPSGEDGIALGTMESGHYGDTTNSLGTAAAQNAIISYVYSGGGLVGLEAGAAFACSGLGYLGLCSAYYIATPWGAKSTLTVHDTGFGSGSQEAWLSEGGGYFSLFTPTFPQGGPLVIAGDYYDRPGVIRATYGSGRVALSGFCLELRGDSEDDWTIWDNWAMGGVHNNSAGVWTLLGRLIGWAYNGDSSAPTLANLPNPSASRVAVVATHTSNGGAYPGLLPALGRAIQYSGHRPLAIRFQDIQQGYLTLANFKVVTFPGGYAYGYETGLAGAEPSIRSFISGGGSYFGICAGSFYASTNVIWQGQSYAYPLGLFQGQVVGEIADIAPWPGYALTPTAVNDAVFGPLGTVQQMYYGGGYHVLPTLQQQGVPVYTVGTFTYAGSAAGKADAVRFTYGNGRVFLITTHPEALAGSVDDWVYWDGFQNGSTVPLANPDNSWRVVSAALNNWLAPQSNSLSFRLRSWERLAGAGLRLHCTGPAGWLPTVLAASTLTNWSPLGTAVEESPGSYVFADTNAPGLVRRFYRFRAP